jgi:hypothetical protein
MDIGVIAYQQFEAVSRKHIRRGRKLLTRHPARTTNKQKSLARTGGAF